MPRFLPLLILLSILVVSCVDETDLHLASLDEPKATNQENISGAVYLSVPNGWRRARSYNGFQAPGLEGSIELRADYRSVSEVAKDYDKTLLSRQGMKLFAFRKLTGTKREGFYVHLEDQRAKVEREILIFKGKESTQIVRAFFREGASGATAYEMHEALLSVRYDTTAIAADKVQPFVLASLVKLDPAEFWLTRNGVYPPTTEDSLKIHSLQISDGGILDVQNEIRDALRVAVGDEGTDIHFQGLTNGKIVTSRAEKDGMFAGVLVIANDKRGGTRYTVSANQYGAVDEAMFWLKDQSTRATVTF